MKEGHLKSACYYVVASVNDYSLFGIQGNERIFHLHCCGHSCKSMECNICERLCITNYYLIVEIVKKNPLDEAAVIRH